MAFGISETGFTLKRLPDIKSEIEATLKSKFGAGINLTSQSPLGQIVGIFSEREAKIWELAEATYYSAYPATAEGVALDNAVSLTGIRRKPKTKSKAEAIAYGDAGIIIPQNSVVSVSGNASARFLTDADATIEVGVDEVQKITFARVPTSGSFKITYSGNDTASINSAATNSTVQTAIRAIAGLEDVTVSGNFTSGFTITFTGDSGLQDQPLLTITSNTLADGSGAISAIILVMVAGKLPQAVLYLTAETAGAVSAPAGSLSVIETPIAGWESVVNSLDAEVGDELETDAALKIRQRQTVQKAGASTADAIRADLLELPEVEAVLVYVNNSIETDPASGRPPKSFEVIIQGGDDTEIAETIFSDAPAGIETFGLTTVVVTDSQGFDHNIKFSRPDIIEIYLILDIVTNVDFPSNGTDLVKAKMIEYGESLSLGDDVIVYPTLISFLGEITGITDVTIKIGTAPAPTLDNNIVIDTYELADFDTSRITVNIT
jgi:uncharacterized phage protein gp47/JayE